MKAAMAAIPAMISYNMGRSARTVADSMTPGDRSYNLVVRMSLFSNNRPQIARPPVD
jgi:hypothetical protein